MTSTFKNILIGAGVIGAIGLGTYMITKPSPEKSAAPVSSISISTDHSLPLTFKFGSATTDICFKGQPKDVKEVDLTDTKFLSQNTSLGFQFLWNYADGAITNASHVKTDGTGKGYNGQRSDFKTDADYKNAMNGALYANFPSDFFKKTNDFGHAMGLPINVTLNPNDTWQQNRFRIDNTGAEYIKLGSEEVSTSVPKEWLWSDYLNWANPTVDSILKYYGTAKKIIVDVALLYKNTKTVVQWRTQINPTSLPDCWGGKVYWQIGDELTVAKRPFTANQDSNLLRLQYFFDTLAPKQIDTFQIQFPGWKIAATECFIEDADSKDGVPMYIRDNMNEVFGLSWFMQMFITYQGIEPIAVQHTIKSLQDPSTVRFKTYQMLNKALLPGYNVTALTFSRMEGCKGVSLNNSSASSQHTLLITNTSSNTYTLTKVTVDGSKKTPSTYNIQREYATDLRSAVTRDSLSSADLVILPLSSNVISFDTKK